MSSAPARHAQVVPSVVLPLLRKGLPWRSGLVLPHELIAWVRPTDLTEHDRDALANAVVIRLRPIGRQMSDLPTGFTLVDGWTSRIGGSDSRRVQTLGSERLANLASVTIGEFSKGLGMTLSPTLRLLARLESDHWDQLGRPACADSPMSQVHLPVDIGPVPAPDDTSFLEDLALVRALPWLKDVAHDDLRFRCDGTTSPAAIVSTMVTPSAWTSAGCRLVSELARCERMSFAQEVDDLAHCALRVLSRRVDSRSKWASMFTRRYVSPDGPGRTLLEVGTAFGVTRERIRQICDKLLGALSLHSVAAPATSRVIAAASRIAPEGVAEMNKQLARMLGDGAGFESVLFFANEIGLDSPGLHVEESFVSLGGSRVFSETVNRNGQAPVVKATLRCASRQVALMGCTNLLRVAGALALDEEIAPGRLAIESILIGATGFRWIDQECGWFTLGDCGESSAAATRVRKMAVAAQESLTIESITSGLVSDDLWLYRERERDTGVPPMHVLTNMLRGWSWLKCLQHNRFELASPASLDVLSPAELSVIDVVRSLGGVATRQEIADRIVADHSVSNIRVQQILGTSPMLMKVEFALYGLRGHRLDDDALARARQRSALQRHEFASTPPPDGRTGFSVPVTVASLKNEQYHIPATWLARMPAGIYPVVCENPEAPELALVDPTRTVRVRQKGSVVGINRHFPHAQPGDYFLIDILPDGCLSVSLHSASNSDVVPLDPPVSACG